MNEQPERGGEPGAALDARRSSVASCVRQPADRSAQLYPTLRPILVDQSGHSSSVNALAFTADGRWLVSAGNDFSVRLWDAATGREVRVLGHHTREADALAICPGDRCVASGAFDGAVKLWELPSGRLLREFSHLPSSSVHSLAFTPDGSRLVAGYGDFAGYEGRKQDFAVRVWDVHTGRELRTLGGHRGIVGTVALSPRGDLLASGDFTGDLRIWALPEGRLLHVIGGFKSAVNPTFVGGGEEARDSGE